MSLPVAIQFYSVRDYAEKDFFGTLRKIKDMGYQGVEFAGLFGHSPEEVKAECEKIGIIPVSAHVPLDEMINDIEGTVNTYKTIGCKYIAVPYVTEERRPGAEKFNETVEFIKKAGEVCNKNGLTLLYHNHDFEFVKIDGEYGLDILYNSVDEKLLKTEIDTCWANVGGEDPSEYVRKYTGRAPVVHLKDFVMKGKDKPKKLYDLIGIDDDSESASEEDFSFKPVGYGVQDMPRIMKSAESAGAKWLVVEQDQPDKGNTSLKAAEMSINYIKEIQSAEKTCRIGVIGLGGRGYGMMEILQRVPGVIVPAVCDVIEERLDRGLAFAKENAAGRYDVHGYFDYKEMLEDEELDGVYIATTWITHIAIACDCMQAGVNAGVEVGGAASVEECWRLVRTARETGKYCMLMENCCYDRIEMATFNMVKQGLFGEIVHLEGGYRHDLREEIVLGRENKHGRLVNFMHRNGELYPTHEIGPLAKLIGINKGNRFVSLVSVASKSRGLNQWIADNKGTDYDLYGYNWACGDVVTTIIKCAGGETITINHDCCLPRPYSREFTVQGTKGVLQEHEGENDAIVHFEDITQGHDWERFNDNYYEKYRHPLWKKYDADHEKAGHGGMDFLVLCAFADSLKNGTKPPIDTVDTATFMVITALSEQSVAIGGAPVPFPDFTDGMWINRKDDFARSDFCLDEICEEFFEED